jgi:hypothetical protein
MQSAGATKCLRTTAKHYEKLAASAHYAGHERGDSCDPKLAEKLRKAFRVEHEGHERHEEILLSELGKKYLRVLRVLRVNSPAFVALWAYVASTEA